MSGTREGRRIVLELEPTDDGIRGVLAADDGMLQPFEGWLELSALLDGVRPRSEAAAEPLSEVSA